MTRTRSATSATTPRSWVTRRTARESSSRSARRSPSTCACTVTSSAAVGSSATRRRGPPARARARSARWRIPPESWWGNAFLCRPGSGSDTRESQRSASTAAAFRERPRCRSITSASSRPIVRTGSSAVAGSWKTRPIPPPRRRSFSRAGSARTSRPAKKTSPETRRTGRGTRSTSASDVSVLPHPDSPTRATISPAPMSKETPSTAGTSSPDGPGTAIVRAWTERSGAAAPDTADLRRAGCVSSGRKLLEPLPDIAERGVRAVDLQERPVRVLAITEVGIEVRKVVLQAQAVFLANTGIVETLSVPLDRELREAFLQEAQSEHRAALHCVLRALRGSLELADGFVREGHLLVGDAEVVMRLVVLGRQLLLDALLQLAEDLLQRDIAPAHLGDGGRTGLLLHLRLKLAREIEELLLVGEKRRLVQRRYGRPLHGRRGRCALGATRHLVGKSPAQLRVENRLEVLRKDVPESRPRIFDRAPFETHPPPRELSVPREKALESLKPLRRVHHHSLLETEIDLEELVRRRLRWSGRLGRRGRRRRDRRSAGGHLLFCRPRARKSFPEDRRKARAGLARLPHLGARALDEQRVDRRDAIVAAFGSVETLEPFGLGDGDVLSSALEGELEELLAQGKRVRRPLQDPPEMIDGFVVEAVLPEDVRLAERGFDRIRSQHLRRRRLRLRNGHRLLGGRQRLARELDRLGLRGERRGLDANLELIGGQRGLDLEIGLAWRGTRRLGPTRDFLVQRRRERRILRLPRGFERFQGRKRRARRSKGR